MASTGIVVLFGGPAGAGKSTLARAWCATRERAAHLELDEIRCSIVSGLANPQEPSEVQADQYRLSVVATCALARAFVQGGYDVAVADVLEPEVFDSVWRPQLDGLSWQVLIVLPSVDESLARSSQRQKRVTTALTRSQHARCSEWPSIYRLDTTGLSVAESLSLVLERLRQIS